MRNFNNYYRLLQIFFFTAVFLGVLPSISFVKNIRLFVVQSGSMIPAIYPGSLIVVKNEPEYFEGDVITFFNPDKGIKELRTTTHRIQLKLEKEGSLVFMTKGDANVFSDQTFIERKYIVGKAIITIPLIGFVSDLIRSKAGLIFLIFIPGAVIVGREVFFVAKYLFEVI